MVNIRTRAVTFIAPAAAFVLVFLFGSSIYYDWVQKHASGGSAGDTFLGVHGLAYPQWRFNTSSSISHIVSQDVFAILVIVLTWGFILLVGSAGQPGFRGTVAHFLHGWAAYIFAGAWAGLIASFIDSPSANPLNRAGDGALYGLFVGWIVGLITLAAERSK